ncbi:MAG: hypothetical protein IPG05_14495 [Gemmatimonadetes bacterium]|nr:hypothetical protein [Gemmatimonadota bacterium]
MISDLLAFGGVGAHPVQPKELAAARPLYECRAALLAAHLAHVEATSPADAGPHRIAAARAQGELAWLAVREAEERTYAEYTRANPAGLGRDLKEMVASFFGR